MKDDGKGQVSRYCKMYKIPGKMKFICLGLQNQQKCVRIHKLINKQNCEPFTD